MIDDRLMVLETIFSQLSSASPEACFAKIDLTYVVRAMGEVHADDITSD